MWHLLINSHVVIVGGGFGGLNAAKGLAKQMVRVTLLDRRNHHLFQPLLYQVAMAGLSPGNIAAPLRAILRQHRNVQVVLGEVRELDAAGNAVALAEGSRIAYDTLILATGATHSYFGNDQWAADAPGLKTLEDALDIRRRALLAYEEAERCDDPAEREAWLTFVVVGGGPTGLELAGALGEMAHLTLVTGVTDHEVTLRQGETTTALPCRTVLWAAGVQASPLGKVVQAQTGAALDRVGRVMVEPDLSVSGFPNLFVLGDLAHFAHGLERPLPGVAPVAMQQGRYVAQAIVHRLAGTPAPAFVYQDKGSVATIGRAAAVAQIGRWKLSGYLAWLTWLFVHLIYLAEFDNRVLVFFQWVWNYFTHTRGVRLILNERPPE